MKSFIRSSARSSLQISHICPAAEPSIHSCSPIGYSTKTYTLITSSDYFLCTAETDSDKTQDNPQIRHENDCELSWEDKLHEIVKIGKILQSADGEDQVGYLQRYFNVH